MNMNYLGTVIGGSNRAKLLGFPTANIELVDTKPSGIYIAHVTSEGKKYPAVAYADQSRHILEVHLFDYADDLYGKEISIELVDKIRESEAFADDTALKQAVSKDIASARSYFKL